MDKKTHDAKETSGPRFRAVMDADGCVRLWYRRSKKTWIVFDLNFDENQKSARYTLPTRAQSERDACAR
jgi:hypothetical protein